MPTTPQPAEDYHGDDDDEVDSDAEETTEEDEPKCVECGQGPGVYPDDDLDQFVKNRDGEPIHGGCRSTGL